MQSARLIGLLIGLQLRANQSIARELRKKASGRVLIRGRGRAWERRGGWRFGSLSHSHRQIGRCRRLGVNTLELASAHTALSASLSSLQRDEVPLHVLGLALDLTHSYSGAHSIMRDG